MIITRTSPFSHKTNSMDLDVTEDQISDWVSGTLIHDAMPHLTPEQREFIMTGVTSEEWDEMVGETEEAS